MSQNFTLKKPNKVQRWLIDMIASTLSFVIIFFFMSLVGVFLNNPDSTQQN